MIKLITLPIVTAVWTLAATASTRALIRKKLMAWFFCRIAFSACILATSVLPFWIAFYLNKEKQNTAFQLIKKCTLINLSFQTKTVTIRFRYTHGNKKDDGIWLHLFPWVPVLSLSKKIQEEDQHSTLTTPNWQVPQESLSKLCKWWQTHTNSPTKDHVRWSATDGITSLPKYIEIHSPGHTHWILNEQELVLYGWVWKLTL